MGANMLMHFPRVHGAFIETSPWEACLCFTTIPQWPGDLEEGTLAWKPKHLTACQKQEGPALWDSWRFYVSEGKFPWLYPLQRPKSRRSETAVWWGAAGVDSSCSITWPQTNLPERKTWEWLGHGSWASGVPLVSSTLSFLPTLIES